MAEFATVKKLAADYVKDTSCNLIITNADEANSRIHFASCDNKFTFYISCPTTDNASWNIWSDSSDSQQALQYVLDSCNLSSEKSIASLLETVSKRLKTASGMKSCQSNAASSPEDNEEDDDEDDDDDDMDDYYADEDADAADDVQVVKTSKEQEEEKAIAANFFNSQGSEMAVSRLVKDLKSLSKEKSKFGFVASPKESNLFVWEVKLVDIPGDSKLGRDLAEYSRKHRVEPAIFMEMQFPSDYPFNPPFIRVVKPRFQFLTGHVTIGGSICMQMLTSSGWRPTNDIEGILVQVRTEILSDPKASLDLSKANKEYTESEARDAFQRMVKKYGW